MGHTFALGYGIWEIATGVAATGIGGAEATLTAPAAATGIGAAVPGAGVAVAVLGVGAAIHGGVVVGNTLGNIFKKGNVTIRHSSRKEALEAAEHPHPGKKMPQPPKSAPAKKHDRYDEQQKYKRPERHTDSAHPERHFHERDKSGSRVNKHHTW